jgi:hypothetical protein
MSVTLAAPADRPYTAPHGHLSRLAAPPSTCARSWLMHACVDAHRWQRWLLARSLAGRSPLGRIDGPGSRRRASNPMQGIGRVTQIACCIRGRPARTEKGSDGLIGSYTTT